MPELDLNDLCTTLTGVVKFSKMVRPIKNFWPKSRRTVLRPDKTTQRPPKVDLVMTSVNKICNNLCQTVGPQWTSKGNLSVIKCKNVSN